MSPTPFHIFCLYYLGLTPEGQVRFQNANQVAKRFNWTPDMLLDFLRKNRLHPDIVLNTDFPLARYQVDLQIAAQVEDSEELHARALEIFEAYSDVAGHKPRDWLKEIEEERQADQQRRREGRLPL
jgi:hypothetical protein